MTPDAGDPNDAPGGGAPSFYSGHPSLGKRSGRHARKRWVAVAVVAVTVGLLGWLFAFGLGRDPRAFGSPLVGRPAPAFALRTLDGRHVVRLSDLRGQVVVVNFWASWCAACRQEHPNLVAAWRRFRGHGVVFVTVSFEDTVGDSERFIVAMGEDGVAVTDPDGRTAIDYGVAGVPETFFIDPRGIIQAKRVGASSYALLSEQITTLLEGGTG